MVRQWIVTPSFAGSNPVVRPNKENLQFLKSSFNNNRNYLDLEIQLNLYLSYLSSLAAPPKEALRAPRAVCLLFGKARASLKRGRLSYARLELRALPQTRCTKCKRSQSINKLRLPRSRSKQALIINT